VTQQELCAATGISTAAALRDHISRLRRLLVRSRFALLTRRGAGYELVVREGR